MSKIPKSHWNYRVIREEDNDEFFYTIREVYYTNGVPDGTTTEPCSPFGDTLKGLRVDTRLYIAALKEPVLDLETLKEVGDGKT